MHRVHKNLRQTHLEFHKEAAMLWIDEDFYMEHLAKNESPKKRKHAEAFVDEIAPTKFLLMGRDLLQSNRNKHYLKWDVVQLMTSLSIPRQGIWIADWRRVCVIYHPFQL
jgi:hypothetical protein